MTKAQYRYRHHRASDFGGKQSNTSTPMINFNCIFICNDNWKLDNGIEKEEWKHEKKLNKLCSYIKYMYLIITYIIIIYNILNVKFWLLSYQTHTKEWW